MRTEAGSRNVARGEAPQVLGRFYTGCRSRCCSDLVAEIRAQSDVRSAGCSRGTRRSAPSTDESTQPDNQNAEADGDRSEEEQVAQRTSLLVHR